MANGATTAADGATTEANDATTAGEEVTTANDGATAAGAGITTAQAKRKKREASTEVASSSLADGESSSAGPENNSEDSTVAPAESTAAQPQNINAGNPEATTEAVNTTLPPTKPWEDWLSIPDCIPLPTTTVAPLNDTDNATSIEATNAEQINIERRKRHINTRFKRDIQKVCDSNIVFGVVIDSADSWTFEVNVSRCNCGNVSEELEEYGHEPGNIEKTNYYPGEHYIYYATTTDPWNAALTNERTSVYKTWMKSIKHEVPFLVMASDFEPHLKPNITFTGFKKSEGGFISGVFNITIRRPHWDNPDRFSDAMNRISEEYKQANESEGVFGAHFEGYVKHGFLNHRLIHIDDFVPPEENEFENTNVNVNSRFEVEEEVDLRKLFKEAREEDSPLRYTFFI